MNRYYSSNVVGARKLKAYRFLHDKSTFIRNTVTLRLYKRSFIRTYAVHRRFIGKLLVDFLLISHN